MDSPVGLSPEQERDAKLRINALAFVQAEILEVHRLLDDEGTPRAMHADDTEVFLSMSQRVSLYIQSVRLHRRLTDAAKDSTR